MNEKRDEGVVRMDAQMWACVADLFAANAEVLGMRAENEFRVGNGNSVAYGDEHFMAVAERLTQLGSRMRTEI
jgi:hypothetical protein